MQTKLISIFTSSAGALLAATATALFLSNCVSPTDLVTPHAPLLGLSMRQLFWIAGAVALAVSLVCLFGGSPPRPATLPFTPPSSHALTFSRSHALLLLLWLATQFLAYRLALWSEGCRSLAGLLGGVSYTFGISARTTGALCDTLFWYLFLGSCTSLLWMRHLQWLERSLRKMSCPSCGTHIKFAVQDLGRKTLCPHCRDTIGLRQPENLKMSCFFCKEHIEFPSHALGKKIQCPHCNMDITLKEPV